MRTFTISSNQTLASPSLAGTLLWIGEREAHDFCNAYQFCEATSSQVAFRSTLEDARRRPASDVQKIILARVDRSQLSSEEIELVASRHDNACWLAIEGPLCSGVTRRTVRQPLSEYCYLHQWRQYLPGWMARGNYLSNPPRSSDNKSLSLAIIASDHEVASSLMDLAETCNCASAWVRSPHSARMRNFDVIWWDDSVASESTSEQWQQRLYPMRSSVFRQESVHVWLTNSTCWSTIETARTAGVACVLTKPFRIDALLETLSFGQRQSQASSANDNSQRRMAA